MEQEPQNWLTLNNRFGKSWPDRVIYNVKEDGKVEAFFIVDKNNNRSLTQDRIAMLRLLEILGLTIRIRMSDTLLTLDEFNSGEGYLLGIGGRSQTQINNAKFELKQVMIELDGIDKHHPKHDMLYRRKLILERLLDSVTTSTVKTPSLEEVKARTSSPEQRKLRLFTTLKLRGESDAYIDQAMTEFDKQMTEEAQPITEPGAETTGS